MFKKWLIVVCAASCCMLLLQTVALFGAHADVESFGEELEGGISTEEGQPELSFEELLELMRIEEALEGQNDPGPVNGDRWFNVPEMKSLTCPNGEILTIPARGTLRNSCRGYSRPAGTTYF